MFSKFMKPSMLRPTGAFGQLSKAGSNARFMATVHNTAAPNVARKAGITRDRATFTIKVCGPAIEIRSQRVKADRLRTERTHLLRKIVRC